MKSRRVNWIMDTEMWYNSKSYIFLMYETGEEMSSIICKKHIGYELPQLILIATH